jgi:hypothetical protein
MLIFILVYIAALLGSILLGLVCMLMPKRRFWMEWISAGAAGSLCGLIVANVMTVAFLATLSSLGLRPHLYPAGTVFGPLGPSTTDWVGLGASMIGVFVGIAAGVALLKRSKRRALALNS